MNRNKSRAKKQLPHSKVSYAEAAKRLRGVRSLPFRNTKNFKPWQKAYLTRQFTQHRNAIRQVEKGNATTVRTTEYRARKFSDRYHKAGNTLIVPKPQTKRDSARDVTIRKRGNRLTMEIKQGEHRQVYYPSPGAEKAGRNDIHKQVRDLHRRHPNARFRLAIGGNPGSKRYTYKAFLSYLEELGEFGSFDDDSDAHFTGIYVDFPPEI